MLSVSDIINPKLLQEGKALKLLATAARLDIEDFLQKKVFLEVPTYSLNPIIESCSNDFFFLFLFLPNIAVMIHFWAFNDIIDWALLDSLLEARLHFLCKELHSEKYPHSF